MNKGGKNLVILGVVSVFVALLTSGISLALYHNSGDIYLDRSRPGYLPEKEENEPKEEYNFSDTGPITPEIIEKYLENLSETRKNLNSLENPFSESSLSDTSLGIPEK